MTRLVLNGVTSDHTKRSYRTGLEQFFAWLETKPRQPFSKALVGEYMAHLGQLNLSASTLNLRLSPLRKLAREMADNGLLDPGVASAIERTKGVKQQGVRAGNWLLKGQANEFLNAPDPSRLKGKRDSVILALLISCGLRRGSQLISCGMAIGESEAIFQASSQVQLQDEDYLRVAEFAIWRADHNGLVRTAKAVGWDKELFSYGGRATLRSQLAKVEFDQAMTVALLASVSSELTVSEYNSAKAERLEVLARSFKVDTAAIRRRVAEEVAGKTKGRAAGKGGPKEGQQKQPGRGWPLEPEFGYPDTPKTSRSAMFSRNQPDE